MYILIKSYLLLKEYKILGFGVVMENIPRHEPPDANNKPLLKLINLLIHQSINPIASTIYQFYFSYYFINNYH